MVSAEANKPKESARSARYRTEITAFSQVCDYLTTDPPGDNAAPLAKGSAETKGHGVPRHGDLQELPGAGACLFGFLLFPPLPWAFGPPSWARPSRRLGSWGSAFGVAANLLFPGITAPYSAYALVGMAAVFAAASRTTLSSIVVIFEMTRKLHEVILPLMFARAVADILVDLRGGHLQKLSRRGIRYAPEMEIDRLRVHTVSEVMRCTVEVASGDALVAEVRE